MNLSEIKDENTQYLPYRLLDPSLHVVQSFPNLGTKDPTIVQPETIVK